MMEEIAEEDFFILLLIQLRLSNIDYKLLKKTKPLFKVALFFNQIKRYSVFLVCFSVFASAHITVENIDQHLFAVDFFIEFDCAGCPAAVP